MAISQAAENFPRGLVQPAGSLRFGLDALLLAAMAVEIGKSLPERKNFAAAELGSGCGAALLGLGLARPNCHGLGLERDPALVEAARQNAALLGLEQRISFTCQDLASMRRELLQNLTDCQPGLKDLVSPECGSKFDLVLANPPYGTEHSGRRSPSPCRESALRNSAAPALFCQAANRLLRHHGHFVCIFAANGLTRLLQELDKTRLGLRRLLPVSAKAGQPAIRVLVHARKNAADDCQILPPLALHEEDGNWSREAIAFCPWLLPTLDRSGLPCP